MPNLLSQLTKDEKARLLEEMNYMNLEEIRGFCSAHGIPYKILAEHPDGRAKATKDTDRKPIVLARVRHYLETGKVDPPTLIPAKIVRSGSPPAMPGPRDRLYYRWYAKEHTGIIAALCDLTAGRFRDGAVARVLAMDFWTRGKAPMLADFARAWTKANSDRSSLLTAEYAYLTDLKHRRAGSEWKSLRKSKARSALQILARITLRCIGYVMLLGIAAAVTVAAQTPAQQKFEVASIKPNATARGTLIQTPPTGRVNITSATFRMLMKIAYRVQDYQIIGGPDWISADRFDVQARPPEDFQPQPVVLCVAVNCPATPVQIMMQNLLADRFQLRLHREVRQLPVYDLTIGKGGFKLKPVSPASPPVPGGPPPPMPPPPPPGTAPPTSPAALPTPPPGVTMGFPFGLAASAVRLAVLDSILEEILGRPVIDKTGIEGDYNFKIVYSREGISGNGPAPPGADGGPGLNVSDPRPSIFTALQEELGLKLESARGPVEVLVIDSAQRPAEN